MKTQIRKSVFETNSSSSHSLTLSQGDLVALPFDKGTLRSGIAEVRVADYGWEWARYYNLANKLSYLLTQITGGNGLDHAEEDAAQKTRDMIAAEPRLEQLRRIVKDYTGCELRFMPSTGYIDHDSEGLGMGLFQDEAELRGLLFGADSYIETSNDNTEAPWQIETDRGDAEYYYPGNVKEVEPGFVEIELTEVLHLRDSCLQTLKGALICDDLTPGLEALLKAKGVVVTAHYEEKSRYSQFEHTDPKNRAASDSVKAGWSLSPAFDAGFTYQKADGWLTTLKLSVMVPADMAAQVDALKRTPVVVVQLLKALDEHDRQFERVQEGGTSEYELKDLAEKSSKVDKLIAQAILLPRVLHPSRAVDGWW